MPRRPLPRCASSPYHVVGRSNNREWFGVAPDLCWDIFGRNLAIVSRRYRLEVIGFVLLMNHYHLLVRTPDANLGAAMNYLCREVSRAIARTRGRINHIFGGRYKGCLIDSEQYLANVYKYLYRNPVDAGLCERVEDYRYSTLQAAKNKQTLVFPLFDHVAESWTCFPNQWDQRLPWLNESYPAKERELIRRGLRRVTFHLPERT